MRRFLPQTLLQEIGRLDKGVIEEVQQQTWPDVRNADELHDVLQTFVAFPVSPAHEKSITQWQDLLKELLAKGRAGTAIINNKIFWFAVERAKTFSIIYPEAVLNNRLKDIETAPLPREDSIVHMLRGWMSYKGPITSIALSQLLNLSLNEVDTALVRLESTGQILRGSFASSTEQEWCERRILARIHRLTLGKLRKEIQPVTAAQFVQWLLIWQHLSPGTQLTGEQGLLEIIKQLQGFEIPAKAWERDILAKRVSNYDPALLDRLCLMGVIGWGRLSSIASAENEDTPNFEAKRVIPTSVAPITFFVRETAQWMPTIQRFSTETQLLGLSHVAKSIYFYLQEHGASFFIEIVNGVGHLKTAVDMGLWELVTAGITTADSFDNLRSLIDPHRRLGRKRRRIVPHQYSNGRWSLLKTASHPDNAERIEATCWLLLKRYGVVFRDVLAREKIIPRWRELLIAFRRLEERGEIRGGRFVDGFLGEQFALPYAVDSLRAIKKREPQDEVVTVNAVDPLNITGFILPGPRTPAVSKKKIIFKNGIPVD